MARKFKYVPLSAIKSTMGASPFYDGAQILLNVKNVRGYAPTDNEQKQGYCLIPFDGNEKQDFWLITLKRSLGTKINVLATTDSELSKNRQFATDAPTGCSGVDEFNAFLKVWEIDNNTEKVLIEVSRITAENDAEYLTISVVKQFPAAPADAPADA